MPRITKLFKLEITIEQFLDACDGDELQEIEILLSKKKYQDKMWRDSLKS